jgi:Fe2+ transport system protein FeoA
MEALSITGRIKALSTLLAGQRCRVCSLDGGQLFRSRAANLGFTAGAEITVVQNHGRGPMIVALRGTRVALGRTEAAKVLVEGVPAACYSAMGGQ